MKTTLNLTCDEAMKVIDALQQLAIDNGKEANELEDTLEEYTSVVDAALSAMGINVEIETTQKEEEEEEGVVEDEEDFSLLFEDENEDEDEENDTDWTRGDFIIHFLTAGYTLQEACEVADILFKNDDEGE